MTSEAKYRCVLTKAGRAQAAIRMDASGLKRSGLSELDERAIRRLPKGGTFTDRDGDRWTRVS